MANIFATLLTKAAKSGIEASRTEEAKNWFRKEASSITQINPTRLINQTPTSNKKSNITQFTSPIGKMFLFGYSPKTMDQLPYYDKFPLVFPFARVSNGLYGINMHYLPLSLRALLMDGLYDYLITANYDENVRLKITYQILNNAAKLKYFKPCVKHYLNTQIETNMIQIPANSWDIALFLPLERFAKASKSQIHANSRKMIFKK